MTGAACAAASCETEATEKCCERKATHDRDGRKKPRATRTITRSAARPWAERGWRAEPQVRGEERDGDEEEGHEHEGDWIQRAHAVEQLGEETRRGKGGDEPEPDADQCRLHALPDDELLHRARIGAERHAHADLTSALGHGVGHHAVDADGGEQKRDGEAAEQEHAEPRARDALGDACLQWLDVVHEKVRIDGVHGAAHG